MSFEFEAKTFVQEGSKIDSGEWAAETLQELSTLRVCYPELAHWGNLALGAAWGDYSQEVFDVNWRYWKLDERDTCFLSYCYWRQTQGRWPFGCDFEHLERITDWT